MEGCIELRLMREYCNVGRQKCGIAEELKLNGQNNVSGVEVGLRS